MNEFFKKIWKIIFYTRLQLQGFWCFWIKTVYANCFVATDFTKIWSRFLENFGKPKKGILISCQNCVWQCSKFWFGVFENLYIFIFTIIQAFKIQNFEEKSVGIIKMTTGQFIETLKPLTTSVSFYEVKCPTVKVARFFYPTSLLKDHF